MGIHPFPFRTRKLSPLASMVLEGQPSGRVEHCRYLLKSPQETGGFSLYNQHMKNIKNSSIAYVFYALGTIDYVSANIFNNDLTGLPFSPISFGGIGSVFMFIHNSYIKESNNKIYELFKFSLSLFLLIH